MAGKRILVTGASGCVGHYISEALIQDTDDELFLLVRQPEKLRLNTQGRSGITVLQGDMLRLESFQALLPTLHCAILTAAVWGGESTYAVNLDQTLALIQALNPQVCQQVFYFSTASILDRHQQLLPEAQALGTDYIRSKALCWEKLSQLEHAPPITGLFPTLVFGGDQQKPYSHLSAGLSEVLRWAGLMRWFRTEGSFHFIHGQDIAQVVLYLLHHPEAVAAQQLVLGNAEISVNDCFAALSSFMGKRRYLTISLTPWLIDLIIQVFRIQMAPWDRFCLQHRYFGYTNPVNPATFGLTPYYGTLRKLLEQTQLDVA